MHAETNQSARTLKSIVIIIDSYHIITDSDHCQIVQMELDQIAPPPHISQLSIGNNPWGGENEGSVWKRAQDAQLLQL